ncbi:hypothetical protein [Pigmentiphaga litoralis]|uniref:hypothetical protein n=1 Tax=Pigmentiphaga litoralis TaxID=516702 RepID=UPI0016743744|nr:hypothetical protein [Pigmentiphaga litoralis]
MKLLSAERLAPLLALTGAYPAAIDLHLDILRLGGTLLTVTGVIEVALRNAVCECMEQHFGRPDWLSTPFPTFQWLPSERQRIRLAESNARKAMYAKLSPAARAAFKNLASVPAVSGDVSQPGTPDHASVPSGQVVAQLTLFFWKRLYSDDYDKRLWRRMLKSTFPNKALSRADVASKLEILYQNRNRVAHHEPVHGRRLREALQAIDFVVNEFGDTDAEGKRYLSRLLDRDIQRLKADARILQATLTGFKRSGSG